MHFRIYIFLSGASRVFLVVIQSGMPRFQLGGGMGQAALAASSSDGGRRGGRSRSPPLRGGARQNALGDVAHKLHERDTKDAQVGVDRFAFPSSCLEYVPPQ